MGSSSSGRSAWRNAGTVEGKVSLRVGSLQREGALRAGAASTWRWTSNDGSESSIGLLAGEGDLLLSFTLNGVPHREFVGIIHTPCHFGGSRPWFSCPLCRRPVGALILRGSFKCRHCARLVYRSQRADLSERGRLKIRRAYRALGLDPDEAELMGHLPKPRGMHWRTFQRHWEAIERGAEMRDAWMMFPSKTLRRLLEKYAVR
jgi:hypothetical protein